MFLLPKILPKRQGLMYWVCLMNLVFFKCNLFHTIGDRGFVKTKAETENDINPKGHQSRPICNGTEDDKTRSHQGECLLEVLQIFRD